MPDPSVPPTPPVPLASLLAREDLALRQIAGPADPGIVIHWAHTSEMADPYPYLLGGELLLTAGVHVPEAAGSGAYFEDYVSRIVAAGGAALGFGLAPVHDTVPRALVEACDAYELPLIEVPPRTTFSGVARAVWQLMAQARLAELRRVTEAQQRLAAAASRPDPVPSVLRQLAQRVGGRAVLYGPEGTELAVAGREPGGEVTGALAELAEVVRPGGGVARLDSSPRQPGSAAERATGANRPGGAGVSGGTGTTSGTGIRPTPGTARGIGRRGSATPVPSTDAARLGESGDAPGPRPADGSADGPDRTGSTSPADPARRTDHPTSPATGTSSAPTTRPAPTSATDTVAGTHLAAYALGAGQGFVLGVASPHRDPGDHTIASVAAVLLSLLTGEHQSGSGAARSSALVRLLLGAPPEDVTVLLGAEQWLVVHARPDTHPPDAVAASALGAGLGSPLVDLGQDAVRVLVPAGREPAPQPGWTLGVSAPAGPREWPAADLQAARALARARATRTALVRHTARPGLAALVPPDAAQAHARTLLTPLKGNPALVDTLRTWLSLHGSWDRTAVALAVHRNTVRQRIARCASLLATDLDDPDVRMELWFALGHDARQ
ncbi:PucR family transcriptional regulator ligand-binding domain-containing protein [Streptomyces sp. S.PB5]|uniref:PucR family transcriptional regulator ligand-binding domain-containing protein n=1 Tax=Streptomyces sp. S.PB5 TaxID=3020844 RepID=UPI0025AF5392|nr:PucR family transcriptional regulator ligand-binding domain-containing protein [Streptomyces sp. S.PB5]MDN3022689.1 PucR family transcriptional regulator ligand-binding domain-containing protein [Streptomyces sp. S.PB5]